MTMANDPSEASGRLAAIWWLQALALKSFWGVSARLSPQGASRFGRRLLGWVGPMTGKHADVLANLATAFPGRQAGEIRVLGRAMWDSLGATLAEYPHLKTLGRIEDANPHLEIRNLSGVQDLRRDGPFIFVSAHLANWELTALAVKRLSGTVTMLYNPQKNPSLESMVQAQRSAMESRYIPVRNAVHGLYRSLRRGESVALLIDYRVKEGDLIPFFGVPATTTTAPAWLAAKTGCGVMPVGMERLGDARYRLTLKPPLFMERCSKPSQEVIEGFTEALNREIEALIEVAPGQWLCTKRRWPKRFLKKA